MKRYIRQSKYTEEIEDDIILDDEIVIDIDVNLPYSVTANTHNSSKFPGVEQFKKDLLDLLENEYQFEVIEDVYDGVKQKGHISNRKDSVSVYFDTYFDLANAKPVLERVGIRPTNVSENSELVYCFIHIRFSDHSLPDEGDSAHRRYLLRNTAKYSSNPKVTHTINEESFTVSEEDLYLYYDEAIEKLKGQLDYRIGYWVNYAHLYKKKER